MAATVAHQVLATAGHAGASRSLDKAQATAMTGGAAGGVVAPGAPNHDGSKTSRKLKLDDFARVRTLGTGRSLLPSRAPLESLRPPPTPSGWVGTMQGSAGLLEETHAQARSRESVWSGYRTQPTRQNGTRCLR